MNRSTTALFAALEATIVVGIGIGIPLLPLTILWGVQFGFGPDWAVVWRAAADIWLLGHGVDVHVTLDEVLALSLGAGAADSAFFIRIAPLGFAVLTVLLAIRAGSRIGETRHRDIGGLAALGTVAALGALITFTSLHANARPSIVQGLLLPVLVFALGLGIGLLRTRRAEGDDNGSSIRDWINDWSPTVRAAVATGLRAGAASVAALLAVSGVVVAVLMLVNYAQIIALYESLHAGVTGGIVLTIAQLAFAPNLVLWAVAWLVGPGFAIGAGSSVSPLATQLGPVPAVPVLGALPTGELAFGFVGIAVPIIIGFLVGAVLRQKLVEVLDVERPWLWLAGVGLGAGVVAGAILAALSAIAGGAAGPGRLAEVGADPLAVGLVAALEVGLACAAGLVFSRNR